MPFLCAWAGGGPESFARGLYCITEIPTTAAIQGGPDKNPHEPLFAPLKTPTGLSGGFCRGDFQKGRFRKCIKIIRPDKNPLKALTSFMNRIWFVISRLREKYLPRRKPPGRPLLSVGFYLGGYFRVGDLRGFYLDHPVYPHRGRSIRRTGMVFGASRDVILN